MPQLFRRKTPARFVVVLAMLVSLLFAQGLRVCLHDTASSESFDISAASAHIESDFVADHDDGTSTSTKDVSLLTVLKQLGFEIKLIAVILALLALLPLVLLAGLVSTRTVTVVPCISFHARRPPLRAPPL